MTQLGPERVYRAHVGKFTWLRHATHTQTMLVAAIAASLAIVCTAAAVMTVLL